MAPKSSRSRPLVRPDVVSTGLATENERMSATSEHSGPTTSKRLLYEGLQTATRKRQKVAYACDPCRERKVRCDGGKPVCATCERKHYTPVQCVYTSDNAKMVKTNEYIDSLLDRINLLERTNKDGAFVGRPTGDADLSEQAPNSQSDDFLEIPNDFRMHQPARRRNFSTPPTQRGSRNNNEGSFAPEIAQNSTIDAMGTTSTISEALPSSEDGFYGTSSAVSFLNEIRETLLRHSGHKAPLPPQRYASDLRGQVAQPNQNTSSRVSLNLGQLSLPPRTLADRLLSCYWNRVHCLYPFVHRQSFQTSYEALWLPENDIRTMSLLQNVGLGGSKCRQSVFYCALNTIFALGCQFSESSLAERQVLSESFFRRSKQLLHFDILGDGDLALVQTFLIVAQFLQSTQSPSRCWNVVGMACRVAQGLGLYTNNDDENFSVLELEMRRRTWHGCVMLDMVVSMTLGRPTLTSNESDVPLPSVIDDEYFETSGRRCEQPVELLPRISFFVQAIKLYQIMGRILAHIYRPWSNVTNQRKQNSEKLKGTSMAIILEIDTNLAEWESELPSQLHWVRREHNRVDEVTKRQSNVLHARFLHLKILLYRPIFNQVCRRSRPTLSLGFSSSNTRGGEWQGQTESVVYSSITSRCSLACIDAAQDLVNAIDSSSQSTATGAWWYNVFYLFTSAMVLILADICPLIPDNSSSRAVNFSWLQCLGILDRLDNAAASECAKTLRTVCQQVSFAGKLGHTNPDFNSDFPRTDTSGSQSSERPATSGPQHESQDFVSGNALFDDEHLREMLWQDNGVFAPSNMTDGGWWGGSYLETSDHAGRFDFWWAGQ